MLNFLKLTAAITGGFFVAICLFYALIISNYTSLTPHQSVTVQRVQEYECPLSASEAVYIRDFAAQIEELNR